MGLHNSRELKDVFSCVRIAFQKKICAYGQYSEFLSHDLSQTRSLELWKSNEISYAVLKKTRSSLCCIICLSYWFNTGKWRTREDSNLWPLTSDLCLRRAALYPAEPNIARISGGFDGSTSTKTREMSTEFTVCVTRVWPDQGRTGHRKQAFCAGCAWATRGC